MVNDYSSTSLMWTHEGRTKSVHNCEVSTVVRLSGLYCERNWYYKENSTGPEKSVHSGVAHIGEVCTRRGSTVFWYCESMSDLDDIIHFMNGLFVNILCCFLANSGFISRHESYRINQWEPKPSLSLTNHTPWPYMAMSDSECLFQS